MTPGNEHPIVLFDGVCNLCNRAIQFIIARDPTARFRFAPLQSATGERLLESCGRRPGELDSMILVLDGRCHAKSGAALRIAGRLSGIWRLGAVFLIVPSPIRDWVYGFIAKRRYRWFGKTDTCMVPTPELRSRFLDDDSSGQRDG